MKQIFIFSLCCTLLFACKPEGTGKEAADGSDSTKVAPPKFGERGSLYVKSFDGDEYNVKSLRIDDKFMLGYERQPRNGVFNKERVLYGQVEVEGVASSVTFVDLNKDNTPELFVVITKEDLKEKQRFAGFVLNKEKPETIDIPSLDDATMAGYLGQDKVEMEGENTLKRTFPVYKEGDDELDAPQSYKTIIYSFDGKSLTVVK